MKRAEEYKYQSDVYSFLYRSSAGHWASPFLTRTRKWYNNDFVFFLALLAPETGLLNQARTSGKYVGTAVEAFTNKFKQLVCNDLAYAAFVNQEQIALFEAELFKRVGTLDNRIINVFNRYWRDYCTRSVKNLYYRLLLTDSSEPKYQGLGLESSRTLYKTLSEFKDTIDEYLLTLTEKKSTPAATKIEERETEKEVQETEAPQPASVTSPAPAIAPFDVSDKNNLPFLNFTYDKVVSVEYPASAILLGVLRMREESEVKFFKKILEMDVPKARKELHIGEVSAKEVNRLCEMMRRIVEHPGTRRVYDESDKVELAAARIDRQIEREDIRTFHAYRKYVEACNGSVLLLYMKIVGLTPARIKFAGLNTKKSIELYNKLRDLLPEIDDFLLHTSLTAQEPSVQQSKQKKVQDENTVPKQVSVFYKPALHKFGFTDEQLEKIVSINDKSGHFPVFTAISFLFSEMGDRLQDIAKRTLNVEFGQQVIDLNEIAPAINLSRERVRQLRDKCLDLVLSYPRTIRRAGLIDDYVYSLQSDYDYRHIREEEEVRFSNEYITICVSYLYNSLALIGDLRKSLLKTSGSFRRLYLVPKELNSVFKFEAFIDAIESMLSEKRYYPYRDDLESFVRGLIKDSVSDEVFYEIVKECRQILLKGYPDNIINSQVFFPANARKTIPYLIEDILREFNRPMTADEICAQLNERYPDLEQIPSKIGSNALRNSNIVAVSRSSTYALAEWNYTEKRGGTIRDLAVEYLNSLFQPIAPLTDICDYIAKFREDVKESSVKANLLAEANNRFGLYYKGDILHIGFTDINYGEEYVLQEKRQGRRPFKDSIDRLERFIKANDRFPFTAGVEGEEARLSRFYSVAKGNQKKGTLSPEELAELERIDETYGHLRVKKERVSWDERLERFAKHITENESLPYPSSKEYAWYEENKALFDAGELEPARAQSFAFLLKIMRRMNLL